VVSTLTASEKPLGKKTEQLGDFLGPIEKMLAKKKKKSVPGKNPNAN